MRRVLKRIIFSLTPMLILIVCAELIFRVTGLGDSPVNSPDLPGEALGLNQPDQELFWSLRPNVRIPYQGVIIATNDLGLRSGVVSTLDTPRAAVLEGGDQQRQRPGLEFTVACR